MLELAALGMLLREPLHGYALKAWLERYMGACLSANYGAIYPLLRRLEEQGYIRRSSADGGPDVAPNERRAELKRTVYELTPAGRERWHSLMLEQSNDSWVNARARFMTKYWYCAHLAADERRALVEQRLAACRERRELKRTPAAELDECQQSLHGHMHEQLAAEIAWLERQL
jgi:DNA-binding PadR family transcriptional regulator